MEMDYEIQMYLHNCENLLRNPETLETNELSQYMASYSHFGLN